MIRNTATRRRKRSRSSAISKGNAGRTDETGRRKDEVNMEQPLQSPPVDRRYMRYVIGKGGHSTGVPEMIERSKTHKKGRKGKPVSKARPSLDFIVELTVCHIR